MTDLIQKGKEHINKKEFKEAIEIFEFINNNRRGFPDGYYFLGIIYYYLGDLNKSKENFELALNFLHVMSNLSEPYSDKFQQWLNDYKGVFKKDFLMPLVKENKPCEKKITKIMKKSFKKALVEVDKCQVLSRSLLAKKYEMFRAFKNNDVLNIIGYISATKNKELLLNIADNLYDMQLYYLAGFIYEALIEKYEDWYVPYQRISISLKDVNGRLDLSLEYLRKAIEKDPDNIDLRLKLLGDLKELGEYALLEEELRYIKDNFKTLDVCSTNVYFFYLLDIYEHGCEKILKKIHGKDVKAKMMQFAMQVYYGYIEDAKISLQEINKRLEYIPKVSIKDDSLKKKINVLENSVTFFTIGRGGSFFFHSLIDGHKEVATIPGVYLAGYFGSNVFESCTSTTSEEFVDKFMNTYEIMFDASSQKPVPGDPIGGKGTTTVAAASGLTTLGEDRDIVLKVDKQKFKDRLVEYVKQIEHIDEKTFFQLIHIVWEEVIRGDDFEDKKALFYHIHNASLINYMSYKKYYKTPKNIFMIRNWLQSLESWMYSSITFHKKDDWNYSIRKSVFQQYYNGAFSKLIHRLFLMRPHIFIDTDVAFVKLEDVKNTPEATMRAVSKWMGIEYEESLLKASFMGERFHSNKSKLNPTISEFNKSAIKRKVGVLFSHSDAVLLNTVLRPWNETFEYEEGEFKYVSVEEALAINENIMDWERKLIDFFDITEKDALKSIKYRKQKLALALNTQEQVYEELKKVKLIKPEGGEIE